MKVLRNLITNPYAVLFAMAHWMIVIYLIFEKQTRPQNSNVNFGSISSWQDDLFFLVLIVDLPAIIIAKLLWSPIQAFGEERSTLIDDYDGLSTIMSYLNATPLDITGKGDLVLSGMLLISIPIITFQWLIIGKIFSNFLTSVKSKVITLSLNDE